MKLQVLVQREGEDLCVVVSADKTHDIATPQQLLTQLRRAVTDWVNYGSAEALSAWGYAGDDFNIGDLSSCLGDETLLSAMSDHGITGFEINDLPEKYDEWNYDTSLVSAVDVRLNE